MSKAAQLGAGRFGGSGRSVSARRAAIAAATGVPTEGVAPPTELPPHHISLNPDNPRTSLGDLTDLTGSLRDHGQKTAITVMNRDAYIRANPVKEPDLEADTTHVVVDGSRRLAAAREAGLTVVKVMVDDDQGGDQDELLESALVANIHRENMDPLDEARALKQLLDIHGSQRALAKRLHRSQGWVSQRLALLGLTPELAEALEKGAESVDLLRAVGNKPKEQQREALDELKRAQAQRSRKRKELPPQTPAPASTTGQPSGSETASDYGAITPGATPTPTAEETPRATDPEPASRQVPDPRAENEATQQQTSQKRDDAQASTVLPPGTPLPYDDGFTIARHLILKMPTEELEVAIRILNQHAAEHGMTVTQ